MNRLLLFFFLLFLFQLGWHRGHFSQLVLEVECEIGELLLQLTQSVKLLELHEVKLVELRLFDAFFGHQLGHIVTQRNSLYFRQLAESLLVAEEELEGIRLGQFREVANARLLEDG